MWVEYRNITLRTLSGRWHGAQLLVGEGEMQRWTAVGEAPFELDGKHLRARKGGGLLRTREQFPSCVLRLQVKTAEPPEGARPTELLLRANRLEGEEEPQGIAVLLGGGKTGEIAVRGGFGASGEAGKRAVHPRRDGAPTLERDRWHSVEIELINQRLRVFVGGKLVNDVKGFSTITGAVALRGGELPLELRTMVALRVD